jgi:hypothetical protein
MKDFSSLIAKTAMGICLAGVFIFSSCDKSPTESATNTEIASDIVPDSEKPVFSFEKQTHDFGTITEGEEVTREFSFTNTGKTDLLISTANASCGCTVPEWPKEPIPPGGKGIIKATFNSEGKSGKQNKKIVITANTKPELTEVFLEGQVNPAPQKNQ